MNNFITKIPKQAVFALAAAIGCFAGDLIGEPFLYSDISVTLLQVLFVSTVWSVLLCLGMSAAVAMAQNKLVYKPFMRMKQLGTLVTGAIIGGGIAGLVSQLLYSITSWLIAADFPRLHDIGMRAIAWGLMGAIASSSMARYIANFSRKWAFLGGFGGGALGCLIFLPISTFFGDLAGRLIGAFLLGLCVGSMAGIVESVFREAWLNIIYAPREITKINLGANPVSFGSGETDTVFVRGTSREALSFRLENGAILCTENGRQRSVSPGDQIPLGRIAIEVCSQTTAGKTFAGPVSGSVSRSVPGSDRGTLCLYVKKYQLELKDGQKFYACHTLKDSSDGRTVTGEVTTRKSDPSQIGIRNLSDDLWTFTMPGSGKRVIVEKGKVIPLSADIQGEIAVNFGDSIGRIAKI